MGYALHRRWGLRMATLRAAAGLTQSQLAHQLGVSQAVISKWETGGSAPHDAIRVDVAAALGADPQDLFSLTPVEAEAAS